MKKTALYIILILVIFLAGCCCWTPSMLYCDENDFWAKAKVIDKEYLE